jgi:hypothetical protein
MVAAVANQAFLRARRNTRVAATYPDIGGPRHPGRALYPIEGLNHSDNMTIAYLPKEKIVVNADLCRPPAAGGNLPRADYFFILLSTIRGHTGPFAEWRTRRGVVRHQSAAKLPALLWRDD